MLLKASSRRFIAVQKDIEALNGELDKLNMSVAVNKIADKLSFRLKITFSSIILVVTHIENSRAHVSKKNKSFHYSVLFWANSTETWKSKRISMIFCAWSSVFAERISR